MGKAQLEELEKHGYYLSVPHGISMWPMIRNRRDVVEIRRLERMPKRYDLVMYIRGESQGVIHRVLYKKGDIYVICGDNCWALEYVRPEQIAGIATKFCRKGKWHTVDEFWYLCYVHLWTDFSFIRRPILYVRDKFKALKRKLKK